MTKTESLDVMSREMGQKRVGKKDVVVWSRCWALRGGRGSEYSPKVCMGALCSEDLAGELGERGGRCENLGGQAGHCLISRWKVRPQNTGSVTCAGLTKQEPPQTGHPFIQRRALASKPARRIANRAVAGALVHAAPASARRESAPCHCSCWTRPLSPVCPLERVGRRAGTLL
ncbi:hypothetical protein BCR34DRAFT_237936 [Clohesyomyces aquaticus]|uniref:Uncharacterized protein n=1 Tax=Clohesyomyces aquaticus TaxID=1231657 RepID=A0A1Y1ZVP3_9PLEO|nr:hypothetical protein BCR34DRAFT_237936 [Clohesyomyces aquaticus]